MANPVAFFDIDGTLFRSSLLIELVDALIAEGVFPHTAAHAYEVQRQAWMAREGTYEAYITAVITSFLVNITGVSYDAFTTVGERVVCEKGNRVYRFTRQYIRQLKDQGYTVVAISQSPKLILDSFCHEYGFDKVYGRRYELDSTQRFTGVVLDEHLIADKAKIVERVFQRHPELSREQSVAVGDTEGDIRLLSSVQRPTCFNPNQALYDHAQTAGWPVVVERKDVVYHL